MTTRQLDQDLIDHACSQLRKIARRHVSAGMSPASAAQAAIRETKALFPYDWRLAVQGGDNEDSVEVWEVEHKLNEPCARIERESEDDARDRLVQAVKDRARHDADPHIRRIAKWSNDKVLDILTAAMPDSEYEAFRAVVARLPKQKARGTKPSHAKKKRDAYRINPASEEVVEAFLASGQPATYTGVQEFIGKWYGGWMRDQKRKYRDLDVSEEWAGIQDELTKALKRRGIHVKDD